MTANEAWEQILHNVPHNFRAIVDLQLAYKGQTVIDMIDNYNGTYTVKLADGRQIKVSKFDPHFS